jgi:hypothetical protein
MSLKWIVWSVFMIVWAILTAQGKHAQAAIFAIFALLSVLLID